MGHIKVALHTQCSIPSLRPFTWYKFVHNSSKFLQHSKFPHKIRNKLSNKMPRTPSQDNKLWLDADPEPFLFAAGKGRVWGKGKGTWWVPAWHSQAMACGQEGTESCSIDEHSNNCLFWSLFGMANGQKSTSVLSPFEIFPEFYQ